MPDTLPVAARLARALLDVSDVILRCERHLLTGLMGALLGLLAARPLWTRQDGD